MRGSIASAAVTGRLAPRAAAWSIVAALAWILFGVSVLAGRLETAACDSLLNPQELALARLFESDRGQRRAVRRCDPILARVARARALDMATRDYASHVTPDGEGPNRLVSRAGYQLPRFYSSRRNANNVEVITAGDETAAEAWRGWLKSRSHRRQVLGQTRFFADQEDYGVGYAENPRSKYERYWVLIAARH